MEQVRQDRDQGPGEVEENPAVEDEDVWVETELEQESVENVYALFAVRQSLISEGFPVIP